MNETVLQILASSLFSIESEAKRPDTSHKKFSEAREDLIDNVARNYLPSGSGFDGGSRVNMERSKPNRIVIDTAFHHMSEHGYYDGWSEHSVIITPSLVWGYEIRVTGRNRNEIKDYIGEAFQHALSRVLIVTFDTVAAEYSVSAV